MNCFGLCCRTCLMKSKKKDKITNMLIKLRKLEKISNKSKGPNSDWFIN